MRETFSTYESVNNQWSLIQGGYIGISCAILSEGNALNFNGTGRRMAVTRDFDLRNAR